MIRDILINRKPLPIFFYITQENEREFLLKNELEDLTNNYSSFQFEYGTDPLKTVIQITRQNKADDEFYICGGPMFVSKISRALIVRGIKKNRIHFEKY